MTAPVTVELGWSLLQSLAIFSVCDFIGLVIFMLVVTLPLMHFVGNTRPEAGRTGYINHGATGMKKGRLYGPLLSDCTGIVSALSNEPCLNDHPFERC